MMTRTKKVIAMLAVLALTVALAAPALALGDIELAAPGSILVSAPDDTFRADFAEQPDRYGQQALVDVLVYKLADVNEHGAFDLTERFASLAETNAALWNDGILYGYPEDLQALVNGAKELIYAGAEPADPEDPVAEQVPTLAPDMEQTIDPLLEEKIDVTGSGLGLYLLLPQKMQTVQWVYTFSPLLVAVPSIERDSAPADGGLPTEGEWQYAVPVQLKPERVRRLTEMMIAKTLQEYNATLGATTFLFDVEADIGGERVFSQLVPLTFSGTGTQTATVSGIPVGAHVTVTEVYSGASYEVAGGSVTVDIPELPLPDPDAYRVPFTNTYTDRQNPDTSLVNTWVREGAGWTWQSGEEAG